MADVIEVKTDTTNNAVMNEVKANDRLYPHIARKAHSYALNSIDKFSKKYVHYDLGG